MTSTIKVNTVKDTASTDIIKKCGTSITVGTASDTTTVAGNAVRSNAIQASDGQNIISQVGATITLGATGDNIVLAGGATQSGFGRTGTVDWQTGSIKTATFTAANGEGYFANTSGGAFTMNLPAGTAGNIVSVVDYTNTFQTNNLTVAPNGSEKIGGIAAPIALTTEGQSVTFVYVDGTEGWKNVQDSTSNVTGNPFLQASVTGACNTLTTCGDCKIATFTGPGDFVVSSLSQTAPHNVVSYMVVAGGGGGGSIYGGGGGAGGFREVKTPNTSYTASPLDGYPTAPNRVTVTASSFPITVGAGGPNASNANGSNSVFSTITSAGGGYGKGNSNGNSGGSGGGGSTNGPYSAGSGNTPPVSPSQGNSGGTGGPSNSVPGGAGGGATAAGGAYVPGPALGGAGATTNINGSPVAYAGGGGASVAPPAPPSGFAGGAGGGGKGNRQATGTNGTGNTGGGGGGGSWVSGGGPYQGSGSGGSGIVIIRYKFQ